MLLSIVDDKLVAEGSVYKGIEPKAKIIITNPSGKTIEKVIELVDSCNPNPVNKKEGFVPFEFKALKEGEKEIDVGDGKWNSFFESTTEEKCLSKATASILDTEEGTAHDGSLVTLTEEGFKIKQAAYDGSDTTLYVQILNPSKEKVIVPFKITEACPAGKLTAVDADKEYKIAGITADPVAQTLEGKLADDYKVDYDADVCPLTLEIWDKEKAKAISGDDADLIAITDG